MKHTMKRLALTIFAFASMNAIAASAQANEGGSSPGGGDICEDRIKLIRDDIAQWIKDGGSLRLQLPAGVSQQTYKQSMTDAIARSRVKCTTQTVKVYGTEKTCAYNPGSAQIICNYDRFNSMKSIDDQYILVHHELAGLAQVERPNRDDSDYSISNQISGSLEEIKTKHLVVNPTVVTGSRGGVLSPQQVNSTLPRLQAALVKAQFTDCDVDIQTEKEMNNQDFDQYGPPFRLRCVADPSPLRWFAFKSKSNNSAFALWPGKVDDCGGDWRDTESLFLDPANPNTLHQVGQFTIWNGWEDYKVTYVLSTDAKTIKEINFNVTGTVFQDAGTILDPTRRTKSEYVKNFSCHAR